MYTNRKTAPLGWMRFYKFVMIPLYFIVDVRALLSFVAAEITFFNALYIVYYLVLIAAAVIGEIGLIRWKRSGPACVYILEWNNVIGCIVVLILNGFSIFLIIEGLIAIPLSLVWTVYFRHRAPLFSPEYKDTMSGTIKDKISQTETPTPAASSEVPQIKTLYCSQCGARILPDAEFCHNCGKKL